MFPHFPRMSTSRAALYHGTRGNSVCPVKVVSPPPLPFAAFVVHRVDAPRDKYGDEFDAVRERTSSVPFQVHCLRCIAQVSIREGFIWWRPLVAEIIHTGHRKHLRKSGLCQIPLLSGGRKPSHMYIFRLQTAAQRFTAAKVVVCNSSVAHACTRPRHAPLRAPPSMFPTGNMGRPSAATERLLEGVCSRAVLSHCW